MALAGLVRTDAIGFAALPLGIGATTVTGEQAPQFDVDSLGYVHLRGVVTGAVTVAVLPVGARPTADSHFATGQPGGGTNSVTLEPDGDVNITGGGGPVVALDGMTFKARRLGS